MAEGEERFLSGTTAQQKRDLYIQRRAILLSIMGATPSNNIALRNVLANGALFVVKVWLGDIMRKQVGEFNEMRLSIVSFNSIKI